MIASFQRPSAAQPKPSNASKQDAMMQQWLGGTTRSTTKQQTAYVDPFALLSKPAIAEQEKQLVVSFDSVAFIHSLARFSSAFTDESQPGTAGAKQRLAALRSFATSCGCDSEKPVHIPQPSLDEALTLHIKSLLRRCTDSSEACRDCALRIIARLAERTRLTAFSRALPFVIPVLSMRLYCRDLSSASEAYSAANPGNHFAVLPAAEARYEPSEEVRTQIIQLVSLIVKRFEPQSVDEVVDESNNSLAVRSLSSSDCDAPIELSFFMPVLVGMIAQGCADRSPAIKQDANSLLVQLCQSRPHELRTSSLLLARVCMPNLLHVHHRVRSSSVAALNVLVPLGAGEIVRDLVAFRESNVIDIHGFFNGETRHNYLASLVQDQHATVRRALFDTIGNWMMTWPEQADYETLLFPYLLTGLHDEVESNRIATQTSLERLGARYETDFQDALRDELEYSSLIDTNGPRARIAAMEPLHFERFPYTTRPPLGVRHYCRRFVDRLMGAITTELSDWQHAVELQSVLLLRSLLFFAEERIPPSQLGSIIQSALLLVRRVKLQSDIEKDLIPIADGCDDVLVLIGRYVDTLLLLRRLLLEAEAGHSREARFMAHACMKSAPTPALGSDEIVTELLTTIDQLSSVG